MIDQNTIDVLPNVEAQPQSAIDRFIDRYYRYPQLKAPNHIVSQNSREDIGYHIIPSRVDLSIAILRNSFNKEAPYEEWRSGNGFLNEAVCYGLLRHILDKKAAASVAMTPQQLDIDPSEVGGDMFLIDKEKSFENDNVVIHSNDETNSILALIEIKNVTNAINAKHAFSKKPKFSDELLVPVLVINTGRYNVLDKMQGYTFNNLLSQIIIDLRQGKDVILEELPEIDQIEAMFNRKILKAIMRTFIIDRDTKRYSLDYKEDYANTYPGAYAKAKRRNDLFKAKLLRIGEVFGYSEADLVAKFGRYQAYYLKKHPDKTVDDFKCLFSFA